MEISSERAYEITSNITHSELESLVSSIEGTFAVYVKHNVDTEPLKPLLAFKDQLVMSLHDAKAEGK
ncbi:hypothetical protein P8918_12705 [Bacillus spizizenii]|nr:hypothetical protein [Bacillus spizizenii]MCY8890429.1 hypothetical protein [Bacillus spizizenii]MEC0841884.1 hypothetical protein [Bacillus spizizenii]